MDKDKRFFLKCLGDFLDERVTEPQYDVNWQEIYNFAIKHQVINIIEYQCGEFMDEKAKTHFKKSSQASLFYRMKIENILSVLEGVCKKLGVDYAFVKGPEIAPFYSVPEFRSMGDVDLLVRTEDRPRVLDALLEQGFSNKSQSDEHEWIFWRDGVEVELHDKLIYKEVFNDANQDEFLNDMWGYVENGKIDDSFHFIYLLHHLKKHLTSSGAGFRQFLDIAVAVRNCENLNTKWILEKLESLNMLGFSNICFALCRRWFDADMKAFNSDIDDGFYEEATEKIFANGVFGFGDADNQFNMSVNRLQTGKGRFFSYVGPIMKSIFPGYRAMASLEQYAFLRNKPFLLPFAWVYRLFWGIKNGKRKRFNEKVGAIIVPKDKIDKRVEELKKWKLD